MTAKKLIEILENVKPESKVVVIESGRKPQLEITGIARPQVLFANQTCMPPVLELSVEKKSNIKRS